MKKEQTRVILIGRTTAGKTTLCQRISHEELNYRKTQTITVVNGRMIDTPGEYLGAAQLPRRADGKLR